MAVLLMLLFLLVVAVMAVVIVVVGAPPAGARGVLCDAADAGRTPPHCSTAISIANNRQQCWLYGRTVQLVDCCFFYRKAGSKACSIDVSRTASRLQPTLGERQRVLDKASNAVPFEQSDFCVPIGQ